MAKQLPSAFQPEGVLLPLESILPRRPLKPRVEQSGRYRRIQASIERLGLVEPLVVFPVARSKGQYLLLDGHIRWHILRKLGVVETVCLVATDDEAFTYNHHVCTMNPVQEHLMITRAIREGVSEERIAEVLGIDVKSVYRKRDLLKGICPEAVELLRDKPISHEALKELRHVKPMRQIEIAELMVTTNNYRSPYAKCLILATDPEQRVETPHGNGKRRLRPADAARIEQEMRDLTEDLRQVEATHGQNVLNLVIVTGYLKKLLGNEQVVRYMSLHYPELLDQLRQIATTASLDGNAA